MCSPTATPGDEGQGRGGRDRLGLEEIQRYPEYAGSSTPNPRRQTWSPASPDPLLCCPQLDFQQIDIWVHCPRSDEQTVDRG